MLLAAVSKVYEQPPAAMLSKLFGFMVRPGSGVLSSWIDRMPMDVDRETGGLLLNHGTVTSLLLEFAAQLWGNSHSMQAMPQAALAAVELHYVAFVSAYRTADLDEACAHLKVLVALAHQKTSAVADRFYQLQCVEMLVCASLH